VEPVDSQQAIASYQQEVNQLAERAEEAKAKLKELTGSAASPDGAVTVTTNAGGALQSLVFGAKADELPKEKLASLVLATARRAQGQAAQQITGIMAPLVGENSEAMRFVQENIPALPPEQPDEAAADGGRVAFNEEEQVAYSAEQPRFQPAPPAQPRRPRPADDDDEDGFDFVARRSDR
jgi:DNA-binding protein YbaB